MTRVSALLLAIGSVVIARAAVPRAVMPPNVPLYFENDPSAPATRFIARGSGYWFHIDALRNSITWAGGGSRTLQTRFLNAQRTARIEPRELLPSHTNYFLGRSPSGWRTDVANYGQVRVNGLYPGIDLVYHGEAGVLEYDFVVHPGADPRAIEFEIAGSATMRLDNAGDLILNSEARWKAPQIYQDNGGKRIQVNGRFEIEAHHRVRFTLGNYDAARDLVIDPTLAYSSYVGGNGNDVSRGIGVDAQGNVYIAGFTNSTNLPVLAGAVQTAMAGTADAFIAKFTSAGALVYMTYLGGNDMDGANSLAVDPAGNVYITGTTRSRDFPVTAGVFQKAFAGRGGSACEEAGDGFVAKINPTGSQLLYSTYLGGTLDDFASAIAVDAAGDAYITGFTLSRDFPTTLGAFQTSFQGSGGQESKPVCNGVTQANPQPWFVSGDAYVTKLNPAGTGLVFSTYLGGTLDDFGIALALDAADDVYVGGFTLSRNFPVTPGSFGTAFGGSEVQNQFFTSGDGFISKLNTAGSALLYSKYVGGLGDDIVTGLATASDGSVWATGATSSHNFPLTPNAAQPVYGGYNTLPFLVEDLVGDAFATHIAVDGSSILYSTYIGGDQNDMGASIAVDAAGRAYVAGFTDSYTFPVTANAIQTKFGGDGGQEPYFQFGDGFVTVIDPASTTFVFNTYFGGSEDDQFWGLAYDGAGGVWTTGNTLSTDFPTTGNATQKALAGFTLNTHPKGDSLLVHFTAIAPPVPTIAAFQNSASSATGAVSPGMIFTLYGSDLGPTTLVGASLDSTGKLASTQAGATITFDGVPAPIVYVSATQSAGVAPYEIAGKSSTQVAVQYNGETSAPFPVPVAATAPGIFSSNFSGSGTAVAFNQNNSLNSAANPAAPGSIIVLYGTGEGVLKNPAGVDGQIAAPGTLPSPVAACSATVGGVPATVLYCGAVPFVVEGEVQVNLQLSTSTPSGSQPVVVTIGSASSQANLTVSIK